jgi:hypothetical protein
VPAGLGNLSAGLGAIVDFFEIDEDLIAVAVAAASSPAIKEPAGPAEWVAALSAAPCRSGSTGQACPAPDDVGEVLAAQAVIDLPDPNPADQAGADRH